MAPIEVPEVMEIDFAEGEHAPHHTDSAAGAAVAEDGEHGSPLTRTTSQLAKHEQLQGVAKRISERRESVDDLRRTASLLGKRGAPEGDSGDVRSGLQDALAAVEQQQKLARNFGEDLMEDMLKLDSLANLYTEDRTARKGAIREMEILLEDVDGAKAKLAGVRRSLEKMVGKAKEQEQAQAKAATTARSPVACAQAAAPASARQSTGNLRDTATPRDMNGTSLPAPPGPELWNKVPLSLRFQVREGQDSYVAIAALPGVDTKTLELLLSDDASTLSVGGLRLPSAREAAQMQQYIAAQLRQRSRRSLHDVVPAIRPEHYAEVGEGTFGRFSEMLRIPPDVDIDAISASYEDGALRATFPRRVRLEPARHFGGVPFVSHPGYRGGGRDSRFLF